MERRRWTRDLCQSPGFAEKDAGRVPIADLSPAMSPCRGTQVRFTQVRFQGSVEEN